jgi:anaerobic magnesium-protoporphyrin IX monomethyl ester cyclase
MRVCLINPYIDVTEEIYHEHFTMLPPLGLGYLAAVLVEDGHEVEIVDCIARCPLPAEQRPGGIMRVGSGNDEIADRVRAFRPDIVGISCGYSVHAGQSYEVAELVKRAYSANVVTVVGGAHASTLPGEVLSNPSIDYVVVGEGEETMSELCDAIGSGADPVGIKGLLGPDGAGGVAGDPHRERIADLDRIPFPRRDLFPIEKYIERQLLYPEDINNRRIPKTTILSSRGCPGNCVFCAIRCTWGRKWIGRSPENIVDEIESLVREYGIRELDFIDDNLSVSKERLRRICELIISRRIDVKWATPNGIAIWTLDKDLLRLMKKAGCYRLTFGLESGDPDTLAFIRKKYDRDHAMRIVRYANRLGMWTVATFIIGFPYEDRSNVQNTLEFATALGLDLAMFYCVRPYPGTDLFEVCEKEGIDTTLSPHARSFATLHLSADEVQQYRTELTEKFMRNLVRRPWKLAEKVRSFDDLRFTARVARHSLQMATARSSEKKLEKYPNYRR